MGEAEKINELCHNQFKEKRCYATLARYVMSELLAPIRDYYKAMKIIRENMDIVEGLELLFIGADLSTYWESSEDNDFLERLMNVVDKESDENQAIIYYLYADHAYRANQDTEKYQYYLLRSIQLSKDMPFVNNRYGLAEVLEGEQAAFYYNEARQNVAKLIQTDDYNLDDELDCRTYIEEFILGIRMNDIVYDGLFGKIVQ